MNTHSLHTSPQSTRPAMRFGIYGCIVLSFLTLTGLFQQASAQTFTGHEDFTTTLTSATQLTHNFQAGAPTDSTRVVGEYFGRDAISSLLGQPNSVGIRIYYGRKSNGALAVVLVGVSADGHDLTNGPLLENGFPCPPFCDTSWVLVKH